jgi:hypothetical protein
MVAENLQNQSEVRQKLSLSWPNEKYSIKLMTVQHKPTYKLKKLKSNA